MFDKKFSIIILFCLILLCAISTVSAADLNVTDEITAFDNDEMAIEDFERDLVYEKNSEDILNSNPKTFTDLNFDINGNDDNEITLTSNYAFDMNNDYDLHDGITISRDITINGNNHVIDAKRISKVFNVVSGNVLFKNLTIMNGNSNSNGGAISGDCVVYNCTFIANHAGENGGALSDGVVAINSIFKDNWANHDGGAIYFGRAFDSIFEGNKAVYAFNSHGGAICGGYAENCQFINNNASWGGALAGDLLVGDHDIAVGCIFEGNSATYNGGALYDFGAINSTFTKNSAGEKGGAMCGFAALNCTFYDNTAAQGNNVYETSFVDANLTVSDFTSLYKSDEVLKVTLIDDEGNVIPDGIITANVYNDENFVGTYDFITSSGWLVDLDAGSYKAVLSIEHQSYNLNPVNITLNINKIPVKILTSPVTTTYNVNKDLIITLKDNQNKPISKATVSVNLNGVKKYTTDNNGQIRIATGSLVPKNYDAKITFDGNTNYDKYSGTVKVTVKKANAKFAAKAKTFKAKAKSKKYSVTLKDNKGKAIKNAKLTLKIKNKIYKATTNSKGKATFNIKKFTKKGKHSAQLKFNGNKYFNALNKKVKITIKK